MTALVDTLFQLEKYLGLELDSLLPFAEMDNIGGYHPDPEQRKWGSGAIWDVEGRTLNALIRALKPQTIVEIGSGTGCSTTHMAKALQENSYELFEHVGHITTIDRGNTPQIPDDLKEYVTITNADAINYLALQPDNSIDFILEDADHSEALCAAIGELAKTKLRPGGVLMAHDGVHFGVGKDVRAGYDLAGLDFRTYLTDPSDCGWLVWQRSPLYDVIGKVEPEQYKQDFAIFDEEERQEREHETLVAASLADTEPVLQAQEDEPPVKVKRARKAKPKTKRSQS